MLQRSLRLTENRFLLGDYKVMDGLEKDALLSPPHSLVYSVPF